MITTAVLLVADASSNTITNIHDKVALEIPKTLGRWSFELKIFKSNNPATDNNFLYDLSMDYEPSKTVTLVNKSAFITTSTVPKPLLQAGCSNGSLDGFGILIQSKLQSMWLHRQTLKGENGNGYELRGGEFVIRPINVFLHGNFKNLIVVLEHHTDRKNVTQQQAQLLISQLIEELDLPRGKLCMSTLDEGEYLHDLASQYVEALQL